MLRNYITVAVRNLLRHKLYSAITICGLAMGMACCILILLFTQYETGYDRFHGFAGRIYRVIRRVGDEKVRFSGRTSAPLAEALQDNFPEVLAAIRVRQDSWAAIQYGERTFTARLCVADASLLEVFTFPLLKGDPETVLAEPFSMVISEKAARTHFGNQEPIGQVITVETRSFTGKGAYTITGILRDLPDRSSIQFDFLTATPGRGRPGGPWHGWTDSPWTPQETYILLREGALPGQLEQKLPGLVAQHRGASAPEHLTYHLQPLTRMYLHSQVDYGLQTSGNIHHVYQFSALAFFLLLIACINFTNLATARSSTRALEAGLRKVVGARRGQLMMQFLGESLLLSLLALIVALALVELVLPRFSAFVRKDLGLFNNLWVCLGVSGIVLGAGVLAGCYPAFFLSAFRPAQVLKGSLIAGPSGSWFRSGLVIFQFSVSIALIVGTLIVSGQVAYLNGKDLGFDKERVVIVRVFTTRPALRDQYRTVKHAFLQHPNVRQATVFQGRLGWGPYRAEGVRPEGRAGEDWAMMRLAADGDFLATLKMDLVAGQNLSGEIPGGVVLNETAVKTLGWDDPLGKRFGWRDGRQEQDGTVIGVVRDFHIRSLHEKIEPVFMVYTPPRFWYLALRIGPGNFRETLSFLEQTWSQFIPDHSLSWMFLSHGSWNKKYRAEMRFSQMMNGFSVLAIVIACLGLFGLASFTTERRTREIGIRKTLGASVPGIMFLLTGDLVKLVLFANAIAWPIAYYTMGYWLQNFAYRISVGTGFFVLGGALALGIALLTVSYLAAKAALANPVDALRYE